MTKEVLAHFDPDSLPVLACAKTWPNILMCHRNDKNEIYFEIVVDGKPYLVYPAFQQVVNFHRELGEWINEYEVNT